MTPVFGLGISGEENFSKLPAVLPEELSFLEIPGGLLDVPAVLPKLKKLSVKQGKALVIRDIMPGYLAEALPGAPLRLKVEFDSKFRSRCQAAAGLGIRVISLDFNIVKAMNDAEYARELASLLRSISGSLEEYRLLLALPLDLQGSTPTSFLAFKHRLFYPGYRYRIDFRYGEERAFEILEEAMKILTFEQNFWRIPCRCGEQRLSLEVLERLRPFWKKKGRSPVFVSLDAGMTSPGGELMEELTFLVRDFLNTPPKEIF